ncbi:MAG: nucleotidyltransferase family protein [Bacteroidota bacterium]|jgi:predicted nucleotidyltransferase|nr:nucleotidyltransferase domain-containing protein [Bacteroidota bacterium]
MKIAGLTDQELLQLQAALGTIKGLEKAVVFGSRATGKHKPNSDLDIALYGDGVGFGAIFDLEDALEAQGFVHELDILLVSIIQDDRLKAAIDRTAVVVA